MTKTLDDLKAAFAGESQANRKYLAFAKKADADGYPQIAKLFRAAAAGETIHAHNHLRAMDGVGPTAKNLEAAIEGENYEVVSMYPAFLIDAKKDQDKKATTSFDWAWDVEKIHEELYRQALETLNQGRDLAAVEYYVCPVCGNVHIGPLEGRCPVCQTPGERFEKIA